MFVGSETLAGDEALVCYLERGFSHGEFMIYIYHMQVLLHVYIHVPKCMYVGGTGRGLLLLHLRS